MFLKLEHQPMISPGGIQAGNNGLHATTGTRRQARYLLHNLPCRIFSITTEAISLPTTQRKNRPALLPCQVPHNSFSTHTQSSLSWCSTGIIELHSGPEAIFYL
jgi:hypothetical protein